MNMRVKVAATGLMLTIGAPSQSALPLTHDPFGSLLATPAMPQPTAGRTLQVVDADHRPVANAIVFVADWTALPLPLRDYVEAMLCDEAPVWLAARAGARYDASDAGTVVVPRTGGARIGALDPRTGASGLLLTGARIVLRAPRVEVPVEVVDADGRPAAGVPVAVGRLHGADFAPRSGAITDARGRAMLRCEPHRAADESIVVQAFRVGGNPGRIELSYGSLATRMGLTQVHLPPHGSLRLRLRDAAGKPVQDSRVSIWGTEPTAVQLPMAPDADGYVFAPVAVGAQVNVELRHAGATGEPQSVRIDGPSEPGAAAVHTLTVEYLPPKVVPRIAVAAAGAIGEPPPAALPEGLVLGRGRPGFVDDKGAIVVQVPEALQTLDSLAVELSRFDGQPVALLGRPELVHQIATDSRLPGSTATMHLAANPSDFALGNLPPGRYRMRALLGDREVLQAADFEVRAGASTTLRASQGLQVVAEPQRYAVRLRDANHQPLAGAVLVLGGTGDARSARAASDAQGQIDAPFLPGLRLVAVAEHYCSVEVTPDADHPVDAPARRDVAMLARPRLLLSLPEGIALPDGARIRFSHPFAEALATTHVWRHGVANVVTPDVGDVTTVSIELPGPGDHFVAIDFAQPVRISRVEPTMAVTLAIPRALADEHELRK